MIPTVQTERLTLRGALRSDFDGYAAMLADPRTEYMGGPFDRGAAWCEFNKYIASWHLSGFGGWMITATSNGELLGEVGITYSHHFPEPELGWSLMARAEGHGFGFEAAGAARDWFWANTEGDALVSYVDPANTRSAALARRLGATADRDAPLPTGETAAETTVYRHMRPQQVHA
ncbi:GNAT family N-acetyltransferase [Tateyamaria sp.]|uniref:GNAT family N-acetyltransferase n=1 Tax=Tateyamaria sp. TaxID=1929288 RepID=UPI003B20DAE4